MYTGSGNNYYKIPDNYSDYYGRVIPHKYDEIKELLSEFLTEQYMDFALMFIAAKGSINEISGDTFSVILDEEFKGREYAKFIEIDGEMNRSSGEGGKGLVGIRLVDPDTVKVALRTDDTIEFTFFNGSAEDNAQYMNDAKLYTEYAAVGVLKYERGSWKRDWDKDEIEQRKGIAE